MQAKMAWSKLVDMMYINIIERITSGLDVFWGNYSNNDLCQGM